MVPDFSPDQEAALWTIREWRDRPRARQYLTLGGFAGTGKTTLIAHLCDEWHDVAVCALAGKAAHVLRSKGAAATTIHSLIYFPYRAGGRVRFHRRRFLEGVEVIIVDEASMVDHVLLQDLLSFRLPTLFVGDHGQLEPIGTNPGLMKSPDVRLESIHRQALENPIIRLARAFREGGHVPNWIDSKGRLEVRNKAAWESRLSDGTQVICGFNKTRHRINAWFREQKGWHSQLLVPGERLICLRNNGRWKLFNGQQVSVREVYQELKRTISLEAETEDGRLITVDCLKEQLGRDLLQDFRSQDAVLLDYGYAITAHKSMGSEFPSVLVLEEISSRWDRRRWRYTVASRAKERLVYCR
jgi:exodeoxyribonuclease-5